jgi:hypothetical protein
LSNEDLVNLEVLYPATTRNQYNRPFSLYLSHRLGFTTRKYRRFASEGLTKWKISHAYPFPGLTLSRFSSFHSPCHNCLSPLFYLSADSYWSLSSGKLTPSLVCADSILNQSMSLHLDFGVPLVNLPDVAITAPVLDPLNFRFVCPVPGAFFDLGLSSLSESPCGESPEDHYDLWQCHGASQCGQVIMSSSSCYSNILLSGEPLCVGMLMCFAFSSLYLLSSSFIA